MVIIMTIMVRRQPYTLVYANVSVKQHLRTIETKHHSLIRETIDET